MTKYNKTFHVWFMNPQGNIALQPVIAKNKTEAKRKLKAKIKKPIIVYNIYQHDRPKVITINTIAID